MRADGQLTRVDAFQKLDRYKEHDIEVVVADLKKTAATSPAQSKAGKSTAGSPLNSRTQRAALDALRLGKGACFLLTPQNEILSWFSTTRTDIETGESFPELDPKHFSFNSPRGWCPTCRGHGRVFPWMLEAAMRTTKTIPPRGCANSASIPPKTCPTHGQPCPECHGARLNRIGRAVKLHFVGRVETISTSRTVARRTSPRVSAVRALAPELC